MAAHRTREEYREQRRLEALSPLKRCPRCQEERPRTAEFFAADRKNLDGLRNYCRPCHVRVAAESKAKHPERARAEANRHYHEKIRSDPARMAKRREDARLRWARKRDAENRGGSE